MTDSYPMVYVEWLDSCSPAARGWRPISEVDPEPAKCRSCGFMVAETKQAIVLAVSLSHGYTDGSVNGDYILD